MRVAAVSSAALRRWDPAWHLDGLVRGRTHRTTVPAGDVLSRRTDPAEPGTPVGSIHFDGSVSVRIGGDQIAGKLLAAREGDLVYSRIDARNGAIAVIPIGTPRLAFTTEFPIYELDRSKIDVEFAALLFRSPNFVGQVRASVVGHSGRRRIGATEFEAMDIALPPIAVQRDIAARWKEAVSAAKALRNEAHELRAASVQAVEAALELRVRHAAKPIRTFAVPSALLERWSAEGAAAAVSPLSISSARYPVRLVGEPDLSAVAYGIQKSPSNRPGRHAVPYLRVANVQDGFVDLTVVKTIDLPRDRRGPFLLRAGDVLLCEGNSAELVGRPALWTGEVDPCVHQNHVLRIRTNPAELDPRYLLTYMQTEGSRAHFRTRAKRTTNLATISGSDVRDLPVVVPPLADQERIAADWHDRRAEADRMREEAAGMIQAAWEETGRRLATIESDA